MQKIKYITNVSPQDENALKNLNYQNLVCNINFKDLVVKKPWGYEYLLFENEFCAIWILNINYMENTSMHSHPKKATSLVCLDAEVSCNTLNHSYILNKLDGIFFAKEVFHQTQSISKDGSYILEIETPVNKFDLVRINDTYGRQGKEYEDKKHYKKVDDSTLNFPINLVKIIKNTKLEILKIHTINQLNIYDKNTTIAILSKHSDCGKIFKLDDFKKFDIFLDTTVILLSHVENR